MKRERRAELKRRISYFAAGLVENTQPMVSGAFDDVEDESEQQFLDDELQRIGKRIYNEDKQ